MENIHTAQIRLNPCSGALQPQGPAGTKITQSGFHYRLQNHWHPIKIPVTILINGARYPVGRPRKYADDAKRVQAFRKRMLEKGRRIDGYVSYSASWRLEKLAKAWGCNMGQVIERLLMEADERYGDVLFPETK
jgi:hypothetical protein